MLKKAQKKILSRIFEILTIFHFSLKLILKWGCSSFLCILP